MAKKKPMTSNERMAEHRQRMRENGYRQIAVQLPEAAIAKLDKLAKSSNQSRADVISQMLLEPEIATSDTGRPKPAIKGGECRLCLQWRPDKELDRLERGEYRYQYAQCKDFGDCAKKRRIVN